MPFFVFAIVIVRNRTRCHREESNDPEGSKGYVTLHAATPCHGELVEPPLSYVEAQRAHVEPSVQKTKIIRTTPDSRKRTHIYDKHIPSLA